MPAMVRVNQQKEDGASTQKLLDSALSMKKGPDTFRAANGLAVSCRLFGQYK